MVLNPNGLIKLRGMYWGNLKYSLKMILPQLNLIPDSILGSIPTHL